MHNTRIPETSVWQSGSFFKTVAFCTVQFFNNRTDIRKSGKYLVGKYIKVAASQKVFLLWLPIHFSKDMNQINA